MDEGNSTFAGATAAVMANVVLVAYVVVAMREDQSDAIEAAEKEKKGRWDLRWLKCIGGVT